MCRNSPYAKAFVLHWASRHLECSFEDVGVKGTRQVPIWEGTKKLKKSKFDQIRPANVEKRILETESQEAPSVKARLEYFHLMRLRATHSAFVFPAL